MKNSVLRISTLLILDKAEAIFSEEGVKKIITPHNVSIILGEIAYFYYVACWMYFSIHRRIDSRDLYRIIWCDAPYRYTPTCELIKHDHMILNIFVDLNVYKFAQENMKTCLISKWSITASKLM